MREFLRSFSFSSLSLFGGLCFATAQVATLNVDTGATTIQATPVAVPASSVPAATPSSAPAAPNTPENTAPTVDSAALLASLTPDQRIARLENQVQYLSTYTAQLQSLATQVEVLRGQMEDLNHQVFVLKNQANTATSNAVPADMIPNNPAAQTTTAMAPPPAVPAPAQPSPKEQAAFNQAYSLLVKQQYDDATTGFTNFLTNYPNSTLAPDAHYWLGDLYLAQGQPDNASQQYRAVVNVQTADKRPDAMVKLGTILLAYGDSAHAKQLFTQVVQQYPNTPAATQAQTRLKSM